MKPESILFALEGLDADLIQEAHQTVKRKGIYPRPVLIAAVILLGILATAACAAIDKSGWFQQLFADREGEPLSQSQIEYIVENTVTVGSSQTVNGYTLKLEAAFSDGQEIYFQFLLSGLPEEKLDAVWYGDTHSAMLKNEQGQPIVGAQGWEILAVDEKGGTVTLLYSIAETWQNLDSSLFVDRDCTFYIYGLSLGYWEETEYGPMLEKEELADGCWTFHIHFPADCNRVLSFIREPVTVQGIVETYVPSMEEKRLDVIREQMPMELDSFQLRSLGAELLFSYQGELPNADFGDLYVVLKDGSQIPLRESGGGPGTIVYSLDSPLILDQVDHILFPEGTRLYCQE